MDGDSFVDLVLDSDLEVIGRQDHLAVADMDEDVFEYRSRY